MKPTGMVDLITIVAVGFTAQASEMTCSTLDVLKKFV